MSKPVLFQTIHFCISTKFSFIWPIDRSLSGATTPGQSGPGNSGNEGVLPISQTSSITRTSPSDCLVAYEGHSYEGSYLSAEKPSVYSTAPTNWARRSKDELISDVLLWTYTHRCASIGRPARINLHQLYEELRSCLKDLPGAMDDRDGWKERIREICAVRATWWWWWWWWYIMKNKTLWYRNWAWQINTDEWENLHVPYVTL